MTQPSPPVWCLKCARPAEYLGPSLVPTHPWVRCLWQAGDHKPHGHGQQIGTTVYQEAWAKVETRRAATRARNHARGIHRDQPVRECVDCQREAGHKRHRALRIHEPGCPECNPDATRLDLATHA